MKPIVGIIEWPYLDKDGDSIFEVFKDMSESVIRNGGIPIGIFPTQIENYCNNKIDDIKSLTINEKNDLITTLDLCDAIIKPGATRIYGYERFIYDYAIERDTPFLGICAGMQLMANSEETKIKSNIRNNNNRHHNPGEYAHALKILKKSLLYDIIKKEEITVNSRHNYHIGTLGSNFEVNGYSDDNLIEAINNIKKRFHLGLQWHPELLEDENSRLIFERLIEEAKIYKKSK